jgi:hypothetical protein
MQIQHTYSHQRLALTTINMRLLAQKYSQFTNQMCFGLPNYTHIKDVFNTDILDNSFWAILEFSSANFNGLQKPYLLVFFTRFFCKIIFRNVVVFVHIFIVLKVCGIHKLTPKNACLKGYLYMDIFQFGIFTTRRPMMIYKEIYIASNSSTSVL